MRFLVTGAAGFIGSNLTFRLLDEGAEVAALVRPRDGQGGSERLRELRDDSASGGRWPPSGLQVVEGDVCQPDLGLPAASARDLFAGLDQVVHCAARVDFSADRRQQVMATNVEALDNLLPLVRGQRAFFNLISTAYVCGEAESLVMEGPASTRPRFRNAYEESKYLAECRVVAELGGGFRVLRPSIVVGAHATGRTSSFNTLYVFLKMLDSLHERSRAENTELRLRVRCREESALNLVPVDWLIDAALAITRSPLTEGGFFHLTNPKPARLGDLAALLSELYPRLEATAADDLDFEASPPSARERTVDRGLAPYRAYLEDHPRFDDANTRRALGAGGACPPLDRAWLGKLVDYARAVDWGHGSSPRPDAEANGALAYCRSFFDSHLASRIGQTLLREAPDIDAHFEVRLTDHPGFSRHVELRDGRVCRVGILDCPPQWTYTLSSGVLRRVASARLDPREAFYARQAEIGGDMEAGLRFANLIADFFRESPFESPG